jgi:uncharacterized protein (DUF2267 family)
MTHKDPFEPSIEHARRWLALINDQLLLDDRSEAYSILRGVLQTLRDRLPLPTAAHFSAQLPLLLRGVFWEGWRPEDPVDKMTVGEFVDRIDRGLPLKGVSETEDAIRAVTSVVAFELGSGIVEKLLAVLPESYGVLFQSFPQ